MSRWCPAECNDVSEGDDAPHVQRYMIAVWRRGHQTCRCMLSLPSSCSHMNIQIWSMLHDPATGTYPVHRIVREYYRSQFLFDHPDLDCGRVIFAVRARACARGIWTGLGLGRPQLQ